jgi:hypothetical protein
MVKTDRKMDFLPSSDGGIDPPVSALVDGECLGSRPYCPNRVVQVTAADSACSVAFGTGEAVN